jgi:hypothetical protein
MKETTVTTADGEFLIPTNAKLVRQVKVAASITYVIVGVSLVNFLLLEFRAPIRFAYGLVFSEFVYALERRAGSIFFAAGLIILISIFVAMVVLGYLGSRYKAWGFLSVGAIIALDTLILLLFARVLFVGLVLHLVALYIMWNGWESARLLCSRQQRGKFELV